MQKNRSNFFIISLLGCLSVISPFAIDMYLPAYVQVANDLRVNSSTIALTLSAYFVGLAGGQIFYGPLLDRFGRKIPLGIGLLIFIVASIGCAQTNNINALIALRVIQGLGGCGAQVAALAMVRDFFPVDQTAKILSLLFLFIAVSPLLAPTIGGSIALAFGWRAVFLLLAAIVTAILLITALLLPEAHTPDKSISLRPGPIFREYLTILARPRFVTYALSGAFSFAGLFTYVAGSPIIFMEGFHLSAQTYSIIFAVLAVGFIGGSQLNVLLLRKFDSQFLFARVLAIQVVTNLIFVLGCWQGWYGLDATLVLFFITLSCSGITYPNAAATAMAPFSRNAGSAAALMGFLQLGVGAVISSSISTSHSKDTLSIVSILAITSTLGLVILLLGAKRAQTDTVPD
jgi:DHA1 family bicyclomycin/chloramphenicol resistance-like MFS transporter